MVFLNKRSCAISTMLPQARQCISAKGHSAARRTHAAIAICCAAVLMTPVARAAEPPPFTKPLNIRADAGFMSDDNVTRAKDSADKLSDRAYSVNLSKPMIFPLAEHTRARVTALVGAERFINYKGLSRAIGGVTGEYQYRRSSEFSSPILSLFARIFGEQYESRLRDGWHYSAGVSILQPVTDRIQLFGALAHNQRRATSEVFDTIDNSARVNLDYVVTHRSTLYLGADYHRGDVVSAGQPSLQLFDIAKVFAQDDAFPSGQLYSYRFDGTSLLTTLGYNIGFGASQAVDISWRRIRSRADFVPAYATSATSYVANQYSIVYLVNF
ncbi:MAG: hypothetical protein WCB93_07150 [Gallionella sp.]